MPTVCTKSEVKARRGSKTGPDIQSHSASLKRLKAHPGLALSAYCRSQSGRRRLYFGTKTHQTLELANVHILGDRLQERKKPSDPHVNNGASGPAGLEGDSPGGN